MRDITELVDGYRRFLSGRYPEEAELYRSLGTEGQSPKTMVVGCCDSRVDPAAIFNAAPGELFTVRNVANLVPPFDPGGTYAGTSAALEFAVTGLNVENILVMGHGRCGGVQAFIEGLYAEGEKSSFIDRWMTLLHGAKAEALREAEGKEGAVLQRAMEHASVRHSIENLMTFPFIKERVDKGALRLRGAYFDIADGRLLALDPASGRFEPVS